MTVHEKAELIIKDIKLENGTNPVHIFKKIARKEYISIHGPVVTSTRSLPTARIP